MSLYSFFRGTKVYVLGIVSALAPVLYGSWDVVLLMLISQLGSFRKSISLFAFVGTEPSDLEIL